MILRKCPICGEKAKDVLYYHNKNKMIGWGFNFELFCRKHLLEEFMKKFLGFTGKMVVIYPDLEYKGRNYTYNYINFNKLKRTNQLRAGKEINTVEKLLNSMKSYCNRCSDLAQVAYLNKGVLQWKIIGKWYQHKLDCLLVDEIDVEPETLCLGCAFQLIEHSLMNYKYVYDSLSTPYGDNGLYYPCQV